MVQFLLVVAVVNATDREVQITGLVHSTRYGLDFGVRAYTALGPGAMTHGPIGMSKGLQGPYKTFGAPGAPYNVVRAPAR
jgi:hypothetical protein